MATGTKECVQSSLLLSDNGTLWSVMCFEITNSFYRNEAVCESAPHCSGDDSEMLL
jgi:hypothetical protein